MQIKLIPQQFWWSENSPLPHRPFRHSSHIPQIDSFNRDVWWLLIELFSRLAFFQGGEVALHKPMLLFLRTPLILQNQHALMSSTWLPWVLMKAFLSCVQHTSYDTGAQGTVLIHTRHSELEQLQFVALASIAPRMQNWIKFVRPHTICTFILQKIIRSWSMSLKTFHHSAWHKISPCIISNLRLYCFLHRAWESSLHSIAQSNSRINGIFLSTTLCLSVFQHFT